MSKYSEYFVVLAVSYISKEDNKEYYADFGGVIVGKRTVLTSSYLAKYNNENRKLLYVNLHSKGFMRSQGAFGYALRSSNIVTNDDYPELALVKFDEDITAKDPQSSVIELGELGDLEYFRVPYAKKISGYNMSSKRLDKLGTKENHMKLPRINDSVIYGSPVINSHKLVGILYLTDTSENISLVKGLDASVNNWIKSNTNNEVINEGSDEMDQDNSSINESIDEPQGILVNPDFSVDYTTETDGLDTRTGFDLPDKTLELSNISVKNESVSGSYSKESDNFASSVSPAKTTTTLYEKLYPTKKFIDYLDVKMSKSAVDGLRNYLSKYDIRYPLLIDEASTYKDFIQYMANFRWRRFNILDHYLSFTDYASFTTSAISSLKVPSNFPVFIDRNTVVRRRNTLTKCCPHSVDVRGESIVETSGDGNAKMISHNGTATSPSVNLINFSCNWQNNDWLITNKDTGIEFKSVNDTIKKFDLHYKIMCITGVRYTSGYLTVYLISNYTEHAVTFNENFELVEDIVTEAFPSEIYNLMDPKTTIFRDQFQYYVNNDDGTISTFPVVDMFDMFNRIVKKFEIHKTTLVDPRPVTITDIGPRINTKYDKQYFMMWSYNETVSMMSLLPAVGYTFDKYSFYNPRKYLTNADYNEACIPLHKGFVRTRIYPWFWGRPGFTWHNGYYYGYGDYYGRYFSYWNMYWWFFW